MAAVLTFVDFFPITSQRDAVATAARIAPHVSEDTMHQVEGALPALSNFISIGTDKSMLESACLTFFNLCESLSASPVCLKALASHGYVERALAVLTAAPSPLGPSHFSMMLTSLSLMARTSPEVGLKLLRDGAVDSLNQLLSRGAAAASMETGAAPEAAAPAAGQQQSASGGLALTLTSHQLTDIMQLYANIMPPLAPSLAYREQMDTEYGPQPYVRWEFQDGARWAAYPKAVCSQLESARAAGRPHVGMQIGGNHFIVRIPDMIQIGLQGSGRRRVRRVTSGISRSRRASSAAAQPEPASDPRTKAIVADPALLTNVIQSSTKRLFDVYLSSAYGPLRHAFLEVLLRMLVSSSQEQVELMLEDVAISSYLVEMLSNCHDDLLALGALTVVDVLMSKLRDVFAPLLRRKGAAAAVARFAKREIPPPPRKGSAEAAARGADAAAADESDNDDGSGLHRRSGGSSARGSRGQSRSGSRRGSQGADPSQDLAAMAAKKEHKRVAALVTLAQQLAEKYFADIATGDWSHSSFAVLRQLKEVTNKVRAAAATGETDSLGEPLGLVGSALVSQDGITAFECVESGLLEALCELLPRQSDAQLPPDAPPSARLALTAAFSQKLVEEDTQVTVALISMLHAVLNISDQLPATPLDDSSDPKAALSTSIKLRLERESGEKKLGDFSSQMVLIDPLAPIKVCRSQRLASAFPGPPASCFLSLVIFF